MFPEDIRKFRQFAIRIHNNSWIENTLYIYFFSANFFKSYCVFGLAIQRDRHTQILENFLTYEDIQNMNLHHNLKVNFF